MSLLDCFKCIKGKKYYAVSSKRGFCVADLSEVPAFIEEYAATMTDCHKLPYPASTTTVAPSNGTVTTTTTTEKIMTTTTEAIMTSMGPEPQPTVETGEFGFGAVLGIVLFVVVLLWVLREMYRFYKKRNLGFLAFARGNNVNYQATGESIAMDTAV